VFVTSTWPPFAHHRLRNINTSATTKMITTLTVSTLCPKKYYTHRSFVRKQSKNIMEKKYRDGMLRESEVSKDSYHSTVKNKNN